eukprot:2712744-Pleurochrysis_carterae.AAC.3
MESTQQRCKSVSRSQGSFRTPAHSPADASLLQRREDDGAGKTSTRQQKHEKRCKKLTERGKLRPLIQLSRGLKSRMTIMRNARMEGGLSRKWRVNGKSMDERRGRDDREQEQAKRERTEMSAPG